MIRKLLWLIPNLTWWSSKNNCIYRLSFVGPDQAPLIMVTREDLDPDTGHVEYAHVLWSSSRWNLYYKFRCWQYRRLLRGKR